MNQVDLILKKRSGDALTAEELGFLIDGYVEGRIPDYQVSAFLMAVYFQGMTPIETATLTRWMRDSGTTLDLSPIRAFKADKHSTGGVGDKVSLVLAPLVASAGVIVPMISGRALGHTGGTLDKLEAIPGFRTDLSLPEIRRQLEEIGVAMVGQTEDLCPADKKIYALRDATATVNSIPLITASILSKKLAEGIDALVLDVKAGEGAIFAEKEKAWELARMLLATAEQFGLKASAVISNMEQPLGWAVGNWLETSEAIATLQGNGPADLRALTLALGAQMLVHGELVESHAHGMDLLKEKLDTGAALDKFLQIVQAQGGDPKVVENPETYPAAKFDLEIKSPTDGYLSEIHARALGALSMQLGAGRAAVESGVDYTSGVVLRKKVREKVAAGEVLAMAFCNDRDRLGAMREPLQSVFSVTEQEPTTPPLIHSLLTAPDQEHAFR